MTHRAAFRFQRQSRTPLAAALLIGLSSVGSAQERARPDSGGTLSGPIIQSIQLRRSPVFDSAEARFWPFRVVNALHAITKPWVIRRELLFQPGETYDSARVNESERNLRALGIFRDVDIDSVSTDSGLVMRVRTIDAWTTTPNLSLSTSGSQSILGLSLQEGNLLGTRTVALLSYESNPDRSSILAAFDTPRAIVNRIGVGATYLDRSDGHAAAASIRLPFLNLSSRQGASLYLLTSEGRVLRFVAGRARPDLTLHREYSLARADMATALRAGSRGFLHLGIAGQLRREDVAPDTSLIPIARTITGAFGPYVEMRSPRYIQLRNFQSIDRTEDIDLGLRLYAGALAAPRAWGYARNGVGAVANVGAGHRIPSGFVQLDAGATVLRTSEHVDSASVGASGTLVMQPVERLLLVGHAGGGLLQHPRPGGEFDLGLGLGLRAFPTHAFTGDRQFLLGGESRWLVWPRLLGLVGVGAAAFVDHAGAWYNGSPRRTGTDAGIGLRLASIREAGSVWRLDLARRYASDVEPAGWVIAIGRGFVFQR